MNLSYTIGLILRKGRQHVMSENVNEKVVLIPSAVINKLTTEYLQLPKGKTAEFFATISPTLAKISDQGILENSSKDSYLKFLSFIAMMALESKRTGGMTPDRVVNVAKFIQDGKALAFFKQLLPKELMNDAVVEILKQNNIYTMFFVLFISSSFTYPQKDPNTGEVRQLDILELIAQEWELNSNKPKHAEDENFSIPEDII